MVALFFCQVWANIFSNMGKYFEVRLEAGSNGNLVEIIFTARAGGSFEQICSTEARYKYLRKANEMFQIF